jgi:hypothetical protein
MEEQVAMIQATSADAADERRPSGDQGQTCIFDFQSR